MSARLGLGRLHRAGESVCCIFRRESLDELPTAFAPSVFFSKYYPYGNFVAICTIFSNFTHHVEQKIPKTYGVKKSAVFSARLPVRGRFVQTLKTSFSFRTTLKNRPIIKIQKPKIRLIIPHVQI